MSSNHGTGQDAHCPTDAPDQLQSPRMYASQLLDHFQNPRNAGDLTDPSASAQLENPACGDVLKLTVKIEKGYILEIRFRAKGCVPAMACGSALTELLQGKTVEEARNLRLEQLVSAVGGLPEASTHAAHLALDTLRAVLKAAREAGAYGD